MVLAQIDPQTAQSWVSLAKDIGLPWAAFLVLTYGAYRSGFWLTISAQSVAEFIGPLVVDFIQSQQASMQDTRMRLRSIERGQDHLGRGIRDVHRRLDKARVPTLTPDEAASECEVEDEDEPATPAKRPNHKGVT